MAYVHMYSSNRQPEVIIMYNELTGSRVVLLLRGGKVLFVYIEAGVYV